MFSNNKETSKSELDSINLHSVSNELSDNIKGELMNVEQSLQVISSDINNESSRDNLPIGEIETLTNTFQNKEVELLSRPDNIGTDEHLELNTFNQHSQPCEENSEIPMEAVDNPENALNLNTNHYYDNMSSAPIMVYQMPCGNFVPFDSLVSVPIAKSGDSKANETVDLLSNQYSAQELIINPQNAYTSSAPHYILPDTIKYKGQLNEKIFVSQIPIYSTDDTSNLFLDTRQSLVRNNRCDLNITETINTDLNLAADGNFHENPSVSSYPNSHLSATACYTSTTDSEVALTLASLGNVKSDKISQYYSDEQTNFNLENASAVEENVSFQSSTNENNFSQQNSENLQIQEDSKDNNIKTSTKKNKNIDINTDIESNLRAKVLLKPNHSKIQSNSKSRNKVLQPNIMWSKKTWAKEKESHEPRKKNLLGQLLKASKQCEPASLIPEGVVDDVIPAVGYRIMDVSNLSEMIRMMHRCSNTSSKGLIVVQEQASLREGAVSHLSVICTGCKEGAVCPTSSKTDNGYDINARVERLKKEFNIEESQFQKMLEILGIFYRLKPPTEEPRLKVELPIEDVEKKRKRTVKNNHKLECKICHKLVSGKNYLKTHMLVHDNLRHTCPYCQAYFKRVFNLRQHIKKHENIKFECDYCSKKYTDRSTLCAHVKSVHLEEYRLECDICNKKFFHKSHFEAHLRVHTKEKPFSCDTCGKRYAHMTSVKKHMQSHMADTKYKCRLCGKLYRAQLGIRQHLIQQHKLKKCDIEAQVITEVISEAGLPPSVTSKSTDPKNPEENPTEKLTEDDPEELSDEMEDYEPDYFVSESSSSTSNTVSYNSSRSELTPSKNLNNWKKPL